MEPENSPEDAFSADAAPGLSLVVLMRIYDMLAAIYTKLDDSNAPVLTANDLLELHYRGKLMGPLPYFNPTEE